MKHHDWTIAYFRIVDEGHVTLRIKWKIRGWLDSARIPHFLKSLNAPIKCCLPSTRPPHNADPGWINARMRHKHCQTAIDIEDHVQSAELRLVDDRAHNPAPCKRIHCES